MSRWTRAVVTRSLDEAATGEPEEDVLERAPPDEDALRSEALFVRRDARGVSIVGVQEDSIGQSFQPLNVPSVHEGVQLRVERLLDTDREAELKHRSRGVPSAAIFALSMTTRRSHSCSASSM